METKFKIPTIKQKKDKHFVIKKVEGQKSVKQTDSENRIVKFIANTYFFIDSDFDMLIPKCAAKSIADRGPKSDATAKIKHQSDHVLNTKNVVGRFTVLDERNIDGKEVMYCESFIPETTKGNDDLVNYKEDIYDNHSIGFRYKSLIWASPDSENELSVAAWNEYFPKALNPEKAEEHGGFWVIKEIELFEISVVSYGANSLTANLTGKSKDGTNEIKQNLIARLDDINAQLKSNVESKQMQSNLKMQMLQMKQIITDLNIIEPSEKDTFKAKKPSNIDTNDVKVNKFLKVINPVKNN